MTRSLARPKTNPPRILIYGPEGLGKTTFGAQAEKPVFVPTENGLVSYPDLPQFPQSKTFEQFMGYLAELASDEHNFKTVIIDSLDWLEPLIWDRVCRQSNVINIKDAAGGYGAWVDASMEVWREVLTALDFINQERGMTVILISHAQVKRFEGPDNPAFDRYTIKLQESKTGAGASALLFEYADMVLFANYFVGITKDALPGSSKKNPKERARAVGSGERVLYTEERPAFKCKNRFGLPEQIPFDRDGSAWAVLAQHIPFYKNQQQVTQQPQTQET